MADNFPHVPPWTSFITFSCQVCPPELIASACFDGFDLVTRLQVFGPSKIDSFPLNDDTNNHRINKSSAKPITVTQANNIPTTFVFLITWI